MLKLKTVTLSELFGIKLNARRERLGDLFSSNVLITEKRYSAYFSTRIDNQHLPSVLVPESEDLGDFFATLATYHPDFSPITALVHVLPQDASYLITNSRSKTSAMQLNLKTERPMMAFLGLIIGEGALSAISHVKSGRNPQYAACKRTLAYALARSMLVHGVELSLEEIILRWCRLRELTGMPTSRTTVKAVETVYSCLFNAFSKQQFNGLDKDFAQTINDVLFGVDEDGSKLLQFFITAYPKIEPHIVQLRGAFNERLTSFNQIVSIINTNKQSPEIDQAAVAFMCNQILPGSFSHTVILEKLIEVYPVAIIWYSLFSHLLKNPIQKKINSINQLLMKLQRDLKAPFSFEEMPQCDISLEELEVLSRSPLRTDVLNPSSQRLLIVSIAPGVEVVSRFASEVENDPRDLVKSNFEEEAKRIRVTQLLEEALSVIQGAKVTYPDRIVPKRPGRY